MATEDSKIKSNEIIDAARIPDAILSQVPVDYFYDLHCLIETVFLQMPFGYAKSPPKLLAEANQKFGHFQMDAHSNFQRLQSLCFHEDKACREDLKIIEEFFTLVSEWKPFTAKESAKVKLIELRNRASKAIYPWAFKPTLAEMHPLKVPILENPLAQKMDPEPKSEDTSSVRRLSSPVRRRGRKTQTVMLPGGIPCDVTPGEHRAWQAVRLARQLSMELGDPLGEASIEDHFNWLKDHLDHDGVRAVMPFSLGAFKQSISRVYKKLGIPWPRPRLVGGQMTTLSDHETDNNDN